MGEQEVLASNISKQEDSVKLQSKDEKCDSSSKSLTKTTRSIEREREIYRRVEETGDFFFLFNFWLNKMTIKTFNTLVKTNLPEIKTEFCL